MVIYVHIPFCIKKCDYCDFLSFSSDDNTKEAYVKRLVEEISYYGGIYGRRGRNENIGSVFFGGGTPSALKAEHLTDILSAIYNEFTVDEEAEITVECNPGTLTESKVTAYKAAGVNRISLGLQSTNNEELKAVGRIHTYEEFLDSYNMVRSAGFTNVNIDLMSALPYQTLESYKETIERIVKLNPEHISAYSLIVEYGTPLYYKIRDLDENLQPTGLPDEDTEREMYYMTGAVLGESGYKRYEISNYAKPGYECKHNTAYWRRIDYIGMGLGASSCIDDTRFKNTSDMEEYMSGVFPILDEEETCYLSENDKMSEFMYLGLRMMEGVKKSDFKKQFGKDFDKIFGEVTAKMENRELVYVEDEDRIYLTPLGIDVSNTVLAQYLVE